MNDLRFDSLGETWINLVHLTVQAGVRLGDGGYELLGVGVAFPASGDSDSLIEQFGDRQMLAEMKKVFFTEAPNSLGHSYASLMRGPGGRHDLQDVISLLRTNRSSKRAVVTLCGTPDGQVPCINVIQFLVRAGAVHTMYFARGQDAFRKFCADGLCLATMARTVASGLKLPAGTVAGFIASSHLYRADLPAIQELLAQGQRYLRIGEQRGAR
jgi:thymidylate synthase